MPKKFPTEKEYLTKINKMRHYLDGMMHVTSGNCGSFAVALKKVFGEGKLLALWSKGDDIYEEGFSHVLLDVNGKLYDGIGIHSLIEELKYYEEDNPVVITDEEYITKKFKKIYRLLQFSCRLYENFKTNIFYRKGINMTYDWNELLFCLGDIIGKHFEENIKPMKITDPKTFLGEYIYTTGEIKLGIAEEFVPAVLAHEEMHKILLEILEGMEALKGAVQYDNIKEEVDSWLRPELYLIPSFNVYHQKQLEKKS